MAKGSYGSQNGKEKPAAKQGSLGSDYSAEFRGYINVNLSDDQKSVFESWKETGSPWEVFEASVADGINLSVKIEPKTGGFLTSATQRRSGSPNAGLVVTARGRDASTSWLRCLYILALLSHKERWEETQPLASPDRW